LVIRPGVGDGSTSGSSISGGDRFAEYSRGNPWVFGAGWRYLKEESTQFTFEVVYDLDEKWRIGTFQVFDLKKFVTDGQATTKKINRFSETEFRIERDLHEWTAELVFGKGRTTGQSFLILFRPKAFPNATLDLRKSYNQPKAGRVSKVDSDA